MTPAEREACAGLLRALAAVDSAEADCLEAHCDGSAVLGSLDDARKALQYALATVQGLT